jgi:alkyl hydroperoxide reductase subunit F
MTAPESEEPAVVDIQMYARAWCPYCAKAKALLRAKGLEWRELDVTHNKLLQREMLERSGHRSVPQIFLDDELVGGYDALARLNASGELDRRLGREPAELKTVYDVAIVGGGPAALTAAMYAARKNLSTILVATDIGGQLGTTHDIANYPGHTLITGPDLVHSLFTQAKQAGMTELIGERVAGLHVDGRARVLELESGREISSLTLIIASGVQKRRLQVPGEQELAGIGVFYCSTCDGPLFEGLDVVIVGGGNSALEAALELNAIARTVYLVAIEGLTGDGVLQDKVNADPDIEVLPHHRAKEIHGTGKVDGVTVIDCTTSAEQRLRVDGVFVEIGFFPNTGFALDLLDTNEIGEIVVDRRCRTGVRGVFAAGDCTDVHDKQIVISVGEGATAALAAFEYLVMQV